MHIVMKACDAACTVCGTLWPTAHACLLPSGAAEPGSCCACTAGPNLLHLAQGIAQRLVLPYPFAPLLDRPLPLTTRCDVKSPMYSHAFIINRHGTSRTILGKFLYSGILKATVLLLPCKPCYTAVETKLCWNMAFGGPQCLNAITYFKMILIVIVGATRAHCGK